MSASQAAAASASCRVLLVDDDAQVLRGHERVFQRAGCEVLSAADGDEAVRLFQRDTVDVVVSDICMPGMDGLGLLRALRERDLDVPVILMTGAPALETAMEAVRHGAFRYLVKPVPVDALVQEVQRAATLHHWARLRRAAQAELGGGALLDADRASLHGRFERALESMWMAFQPIVSCSARSVAAYEALMRCREPSLPDPGAVLRAAERLGRSADVGRRTRALVAEAAPSAPADARLFVNLQMSDLLDDALFDPTAPLSRHAGRVVLEITERASIDELPDARERVARLRALGYRIAIDDLGAGYSSLTSFAQLEPEVVKLDMALVRDIHRTPIKQKLVASFARLGADLGIQLVAEGVETPEERDALLGLGCDLLQGYLYARPAAPFPTVRW